MENTGVVLLDSWAEGSRQAYCRIRNQYFGRNSYDMIEANLHSNNLSSIQLNFLTVEKFGNSEGDPVTNGFFACSNRTHAKLNEGHRDIGVIERSYLQSQV